MAGQSKTLLVGTGGREAIHKSHYLGAVHGMERIMGRVKNPVRELFELVPHEGPLGHGPAQYWHVPGSRGTIGFIAGVSEHFCESCNRLRLTADGRLRTCLFSGEETVVRPLIAHPDELRAAILAAVSGKSFDRCREQRANERAMSEIGG